MNTDLPTATQPPANRSRREVSRHRRKRAHLSLVATALVTALVVGGAAWALFFTSETFRGGTITSGDLTLTSGAATWEQVTPGVTNPESGELTGDAPDFFAMPGDVIEVTAPVTTTLVGENLNAGIFVDFADASASSDVDAGVIAVSFHVRNAAGSQVAPATGQADFGSVVEVPGLSGSNAGTTEQWDVVVRIEVLGEYVWVPSTPADSAGEVATGHITIDLRQLRAGDGYLTGGGT